MAVVAFATFASAVGAERVQAQSAGAVRRDTIAVRKLTASRVTMDSLMTIIRSLDQTEFGSDQWLVLSKHLETLMGAPTVGKVTFRINGGSELAMPKGWIGLNPSGPSETYADSNGQRVTYLAYPLIVSVEPDSPAGHAGIAPGDVLLAYNGVDVIGHELNMTRLLIPDHKLDVTVRHDGEPKDYSLVIAKAPSRLMYRRLDLGAAPNFPNEFYEKRAVAAARASVAGGGVLEAVPRATMIRGPMLPGGMFIISRDGVLGASMVDVGPDLAKVLKISTGILVKQVPETSPAWTSGLRVGDVIVNAGSQPVTTLDELRAAFSAHMRARELTLKVVRDHKTHDVTLSW